MSLSPAERFARYMHQPPAWASREDLADRRAHRERNYQVTQDWTDRNRHAWPGWFDVTTPRQRRRIRKKLRRKALDEGRR